MSHRLSPTAASPPSVSRLFPLHPSLLPHGSSPFGFHGVSPLFQPIAQATGERRPNDLPKRRVSEARRQRTPMSCDRCKVRKIKVWLYSVSILTTLVYQSDPWTMWLLLSHEIPLSNYGATKTPTAIFYFR